MVVGGPRPLTKKDQESSVSVKVCPKCYAAQNPGPVCRFCKHVFEIQSREVEEQEGDLVEVDPAVVQRMRMKEQSAAQTEAELAELGRQRGYKHYRRWAHHVFQSRQRRKLQGVLHA